MASDAVAKFQAFTEKKVTAQVFEIRVVLDLIAVMSRSTPGEFGKEAIPKAPIPGYTGVDLAGSSDRVSCRTNMRARAPDHI